MRNSFQYWLWLLVSNGLLVQLLTGAFAEQLQDTQECDDGFEISHQIQQLEGKLNRIQDLLKAQEQPSSENKLNIIWKGNQSTFGSFKRLTNEAKLKVTGFHLENTQDLDIGRLLDELRPCTNLETLKLSHVEILGTFPNTSTTKLTLPKLQEFEIVLDNYPDVSSGDDSGIFFQRQTAGTVFGLKQIFESRTNIKVGWVGSTKLLIDHDFGEVIYEQGSSILSHIDPKYFKLKKLTLGGTVSLDKTKIPIDLTYLNVRIIQRDIIVRPRTKFNELVKNLKNLKSLHMSVTFDSEFKTIIDLSDLPLTLEHASFSNLRINSTGISPSLHHIKTILFDGCLIDDNAINIMYQHFRNLKKIAIIFRSYHSQKHCHNFLYNMVTADNYLPKLESIFIYDCHRYFSLESNRPNRYVEIEEFLSNFGLNKNAEAFLLERHKGNTNEWVWSGRNTTYQEKRLFQYEFSDMHKFKSVLVD